MSRDPFIRMKDNQFYANSDGYEHQLFGVPSATSHKYKLDPVATMVMQ